MLDRADQCPGTSKAASSAAPDAADYPVTITTATARRDRDGPDPGRDHRLGRRRRRRRPRGRPVGAPKITWGGSANGSTDGRAQATELGVTDGDIARYDDSAGIPFDDIAATSPDLILGLSSGVSKEDYDKLTKIAPVVPYTVAPWGTPWQDQLEAIGTALGKAGPSG